MDTTEIAQKLAQHCQNGTEAQGLQDLYADNAVSIEPMAPEGQNPVSEGVAAIQAKHDWWAQNFEVHSVSQEGPFVNGKQFSMIFDLDCTDKNSGQRWQGKEVALYEVENGKIMRESFFMMPMG